MKETLGVFGMLIVGLAVVVILIIGGAVFRIWYINEFGTATQNAQTNATRQTNQYITTQNAAALQHIDDYLKASTDGQRAFLVSEVWNDISTLTPDNYASEVARFLAAHPRGSQ